MSINIFLIVVIKDFRSISEWFLKKTSALLLDILVGNHSNKTAFSGLLSDYSRNFCWQSTFHQFQPTLNGTLSRLKTRAIEPSRKSSKSWCNTLSARTIFSNFRSRNGFSDIPIVSINLTDRHRNFHIDLSSNPVFRKIQWLITLFGFHLSIVQKSGRSIVVFHFCTRQFQKLSSSGGRRYQPIIGTYLVPNYFRQYSLHLESKSQCS